MKTALFCGSFDPVHDGHLYLIEQAIKQGYEVLVAVCGNPNKKGGYSLDLQQAGALTNMNIQMDPDLVEHTKVITSGHSLVNICLDSGCDVLLRGYRTKEEAEHEKRDFEAVRELLPWGTGLLLIESDSVYKDLSSTKVRGEIREYIHSEDISVPTAAIMNRVLNNRTTIAVIGQNSNEVDSLCDRICCGSPECFDFNYHTWKIYTGDNPGSKKLRDQTKRAISGTPKDASELLELMDEADGLYSLWAPYWSQAWRLFSKKSKADVVLYKLNNMGSVARANGFVVVAGNTPEDDEIAEELNRRRKINNYGLVIQFKTEPTNPFYRPQVGKLVTTIRNKIREDNSYYEHEWQVPTHEEFVRGK